MSSLAKLLQHKGRSEHLQDFDTGGSVTRSDDLALDSISAPKIFSTNLSKSFIFCKVKNSLVSPSAAFISAAKSSSSNVKGGEKILELPSPCTDVNLEQSD